MSLPTNALFLDVDGKEISREFVNIGWFWTPQLMVKELMKLTIPEKAYSVYLYSKQIPVRVINHARGKEVEIEQLENVLGDMDREQVKARNAT